MVTVIVWDVLCQLHYLKMNCTFCYCCFSVEMQSSVAMGGDAGVPVLEDVTDEEAEVMSASESKETTPRQTKLKVPQK